MNRKKAMSQYGLFVSFDTASGNGDALATALMEGSRAMAAAPGCLPHLMFRAEDAPDTVWVTELWENQAVHDAAVETPLATDITQRVMVLAGNVRTRITSEFVGGHAFGRELEI
jgi:quinol monooxygenase YgiN